MNSVVEVSQWRSLVHRVAMILDALDATGWIVGGSLRDVLLGQLVHDLDLAVTADALLVAHRLTVHSRGSMARLRHATIRVALDEFPGVPIDLTHLHGSRIEDDLALRDFRMNALALPLAARERFLEWLQHDIEPLQRSPSELVDPFAGLDDLRARRLDIVSPIALRDDPGRILRAARLAAHLNLNATEATVSRAREAATKLNELADERIREELNLLFALPQAASGFALLRDMGALEALFFHAEAAPREDHLVGSLAALSYLHQSNDIPADSAYARLPVARLRAWCATVAPGESLGRIVVLGWATLLHTATPHAPEPEDVATKGDTAQFIHGLPRRVRSVLVAWREARVLIMQKQPDEAAIRLYFERFGPYGETAVDALLVALACHQAQVASGGAVAEAELAFMAENAGHILTAYFNDPAQLMPPSLLDGAQVIQHLGVAQGPLVGRILRAVRTEQLSGTIATVEEALAFARRLAADAR